MSTKLTVVIPHGNSFEPLKKLLISLNEQFCYFAFEVIVVCNPHDKYAQFPVLETNYALRWYTSDAGANKARQKGI